MTSPRLGTARGDLTVYDGRVLIGFIRSSGGAVYAYDSDGSCVGTFTDRKAAQIALSARSAANGRGA
ncbi:hypothetical protein [Methylobacterium nigriterrae]|uniref:hypothetical protein n=1 Tax=Methylobacterium nigriterrae TaxID=3127512 RepID=UPI0030137CE6